MQSNSMSIGCPSCASVEVRNLGEIPPSSTFAGRMLESELSGGSLFRCRRCELYFRAPRLSEDELNELYRAGNEESWPDASSERNDWQLISEWLSSRKDARYLLDVGCFDGRLLESLRGDYRRAGVEIHPEAARRAQAKGVEIVGGDFANLPQLDPAPDVVLAVDVIEHSPDPRKFLESLMGVVRPGGFIIVTTGNTEAPSWRLMGARYWYCHIAEHISFINPTWARLAAPSLGLALVETRRFSHVKCQSWIRQAGYEMSVNLLLRFAPRIFASLRRRGFGQIDLVRYPGLEMAPPYWMSSQDHMMLVFKKE